LKKATQLGPQSHRGAKLEEMLIGVVLGACGRYHISKQRDIAVEIQSQRQFRMIKEQVEQQMLEDEQRQQIKSDEHHQQQMAQDDGSGAASPAGAHPPVLQHQLLEEFASARMAEAAQTNGYSDTMPALYFGESRKQLTRFLKKKLKEV
jgi:hypothetical protein